MTQPRQVIEALKREGGYATSVPPHLQCGGSRVWGFPNPRHPGGATAFFASQMLILGTSAFGNADEQKRG